MVSFALVRLPRAGNSETIVPEPEDESSGGRGRGGNRNDIRKVRAKNPGNGAKLK